MKLFKFKKVLAFVLAFAMVAGYAVSVSAASASTNTGSSSSSSNFDEALEQLNDASWSEYYKLIAGTKKYAGADIVIKASEGYTTAYPDGFGADDTDYDWTVTTVDGKENVLQTPDIGSTTWKVNAPEDGVYALDIYYYPTEAKSANIERTLRIDGEILYSELRNLVMSKIWKDQYVTDDDGNIIFEKDETTGNESRPSKVQAPEWRKYTLSDSTGYYSGELLIYLDKGEHEFTLEAQREPVALESLVLRAPTKVLTYEEYKKAWEDKGATDAPAGSQIYLPAETPSSTSDSTLYPAADRTSSINTPMSASSTLINSIGGTNWATVGQWVEWTFDVEEAGFYTINFRFSQGTAEGVFVSRKLLVDGEVPFEEANYLEFMYDDSWQINPANDGTTNFKIYLEPGEHTVKLEVTLGHLGDVIQRVRTALAGINEVYLKILQITGTDPDAYTDYKFYSRIPKEIEQMRELANELYAISEEFQNLSGVTSSNTATLENIARILEKMAKDSEGQIAKNFTSLKSNIGTLGTWVNNIQKQALTLDYILIQPEGDALPKAEANFWQDLWFEVQSFWFSFFKNDDSFTSDAEEGATQIDVWTVVSRESTLIIRDMIKDDFSKSYPNIAVNLKLVSGATLLPATLAGQGPDVMMGTGENTVINYAVRGALLPLNDYEEFQTVSSRFLIEAMRPVTVAVDGPEGEMRTYGIPHTMSYSAMFYRTDIFAELGLDVPTTWDEFRGIIPKLQAKNYTLGMSRSLDMFILQHDADIYADNGVHIAYGGDVQLDAFTTMTEFFTLYTLPISYDASNRFRTGEMPLIISDLVSFYNQFTAFATELKGLWSFTNVPGVQREDGTINRSNVLAVTSLIIMKDALTRGTDAASFKYIEWWTRDYIQSQYGNELIALMGAAAKYNTANVKAYLEMDWSARESRVIMNEIFPNLVGVPDMPGSYIIARYVNFAFLAAYNDGASPSDELLGYVELIDKEFDRKRDELNRDFFIPEESYFQEYFKNSIYSKAQA
ncbi:MAG: extracellular solute-binding protein [Clostridia bacterium]|nr:extracellular solute-binding protein [Clostridia bacterium]